MGLRPHTQHEGATRDLPVGAPRWPRRTPRRAPRRAHRRAHRGASVGQAGFSLIEALVAVALMGTVILAIAAGMVTLMGTSAATSSQQRLQASLTSFTESLKASPYLPCSPGGAPPATPAAYTTSFGQWPGRWSAPVGVARADITGVEYWTPAPNAAALGQFAATCPTAGDQGAQRLTVRVELTDGTATTGQIVLRRTGP